MRLRREARTLKQKALSSLRRGLKAFNDYDNDGRATTVLLHLQHACEMLLKAALFQKRVNIFDGSGRTFSLEKCANLANQHCGVTEGEAGLVRAIDSLRNAEQHWLLWTDEDVLYLHARGLVTVVDDILKRFFEDDLSSYLPSRILPVSTQAPKDIAFIVDREFKKIGDLLAPGRRARDEARGRIRALLAMESHIVDEVAVSERDISRIEKAIRAGKAPKQVFPRLGTLATTTTGDGINVKVHFTKKQGAPVRFVSADDTEEAGAVRELDLSKKYYLPAAKLAAKVGLTGPRSTALRKYIGIDADKDCAREFVFGKSRFFQFSDNAVRKMREAINTEDMETVWSAYKKKSGFGRGKPTCANSARAQSEPAVGA
jgi:hypothetical protein